MSSIERVIAKHGEEIRQSMTAELSEQTRGLVTDVELENNIYELAVSAILNNGTRLDLQSIDIGTLAEDYPDGNVGY
jgi:hypothetical protein